MKLKTKKETGFKLSDNISLKVNGNTIIDCSYKDLLLIKLLLEGMI